MSDPYSRYFAVNRLSPGRAALVAKQILRMADRFGEAMLIDLATRLLERAEHYGRMSHYRRGQSGRRGEGSAYKVDKRVDRNIKGYTEQLETVIADYGDEHPLGQAAIALRQDTVPEGHYAVTSLPYEDEVLVVEAIVERLQREDRATLAEMNVLYYLTRLEQLVPLYVEALEVRRIITSGDIKTAREEMHRALCDLVGFICARFSAPVDAETRDDLLAPVDDQQDRISALMRARRLAGQTGATPDEDGELDELLAAEGEMDAAGDVPGVGPDAAPDDGAPGDGAPAAEAAGGEGNAPAEGVGAGGAPVGDQPAEAAPAEGQPAQGGEGAGEDPVVLRPLPR